MTGGAFSLIQMAMIAYNYDDWKTFIGDFTKFGLAALSILFDLIFIIQHYILYRHSTSLQVIANVDDKDLLLPTNVDEE